MEQEIFERMPVPRAYFKMALPVVMSMLVSLVYNMVDTWFIAQTQDTALVAGVSLCAPLFTLMVAMGDIFGLGGSSLISRLLGQGLPDRAAVIASSAVVAAVVCGSLLTLAGLGTLEHFVWILGGTETI